MDECTVTTVLVLPRGGGGGLRAWEQSNIFRCSAWVNARLVLDCYSISITQGNWGWGEGLGAGGWG